MSTNFRQQVVPEKPKVLGEERIFVYSPIATANSKGIASFETKDFSTVQGKVKLRWPMDMMVEQLADPTVRPSLTKVLSDEFEKTTIVTKLINPATGIEYESETAEIKLNRRTRNALTRPELVMLGNDFEAEVVTGPAGESFNKYNIKRQNPLLTPTVVQLDPDDFELASGIININWPFAHETTSYGLVKIKTAGGLNFDAENALQLDVDVVRANTRIKPTYTEDDTDYIDLETGLAKRDVDGNTLIKITKAAVGLDSVENKAFSEWEYDDFGTAMKAYLQAQYDAKLNKALWDGESGLFRDWDTADASDGTVRKYLELLSDEDSSLWASIQSLGLFLGFFATQSALETAHPASESLSGHLAYVTATSTYWIVVYNVDVWEWQDTLAEFDFMELMELDPDNLQQNGDVPSVGSSGKWVNSDHVHPSDAAKLDVGTTVQITTDAPGDGDFTLEMATPIVNIPYIRTAKHLHNWKNSLPDFVQDETTNESYWAGTAAEFDNVLFNELPAGSLVVVDDDEEYEPGDLVLSDVMDELGITVPARGDSVIDNFVVVDVSNNVYGVPVTITKTSPTGDDQYRRRVEALTMADAETPQKLAVVVNSANGPTLAKLTLTANRLLKSDSAGRLETTTLNPNNIPFTGVGSDNVQLAADRVIISDVGNLIKTWSSGIVANRPIGSNGAHTLSVILLDTDKVVRSDSNGALESVDWLEANLVKTDLGETPATLTEGAVVIASAGNVVESWVDNGVEDALVVRGATPGSVKLRTHLALNKILVTDADGTLRELPHGDIGQMLVSDGEDGPGWVDVPEAFEYLPQTVLTENPDEETALAFKGLVAVFAQVAPENMRPNCIYYY